MIDELDFDSVVSIEVPVKLNKQTYVLKEASGETAAKYKNAMLRATKLEDGKVSAIDGMADSELLLVSLCLFRRVERDGGTADEPVTVAFVKTLPSRVVSKLYDTAKKISELDQDETVEALEKKIKESEEKIKKINSGSDPAKNGRTSSTDGTGSPSN